MNNQARLQALSQFLKGKRARIAPQAVGLNGGLRRRTPGLRREEVAQLAGLSTTWYTWLEQGRDIQASASVLENVASALQMTTDERKYLFSLALDKSSNMLPAASVEEQPQISPSLAKILEQLRYCPTIISDRHCNIVGWNEAARHVFLDFEQIPEHQRNMIALLFDRKEFRRLAVNWKDFAADFLAIFRAYYGQYMEDDWYETFLREMKSTYPDFNPLWEESKVSSAPQVVLEFRHARGGKMLFELSSLIVQGSTELRCSIYTPVQDSATEVKLMALMERAKE
ncbi:helix-turn-helix transcriptional regulator [Paenibacillus hunanensis]|uniref:Transcriptional regulator with XRE-family HTH domain n=1 Tax=Paenibacillus hunanensis TaxID=539262 RepID=A0ABU1ITS2_9BACL|nr:helix-turn-helix transcriptional regulator [Paenibacillus hunanensis]MDR6242405.1 transcriptional regulator with XRE-family HTH domain [Paenibacillus hunanensis]GGJ07565.1 transcriptional regulator [Paenibacillus hunanensis]